MNIKKIIISMTTFLCLFFAVVFLLNFNNGEEGKLDITKVNDVVKTVEENWNSDFQKAIDKAQNYGFDISIIANNEEVKGVSREGLSTSINEAIKNRDTIADVTVNNELVGKVVFYNNDSYIYKQLKNRNLNVSILCIMVFYIITIGYFIYINKVVVKPFNKLKKFARSVAIGNLDMPLAMDKDNIFGAFTESFDIMREELKIARENERKANESKKELVASLSHDIKTPLASIKAINELMSVQVANNKQKEKLATIDKKVNQIELLINNLFHATLEELKELKVESKDEQSCILKEIINDADVEDMNYGRNAAVGLGVYLNNDDYNKLKNQVDQSKKAVNISCDVDNLQNAKEVSSKIGEILTKELKSPYRSCYYEVSKNIRIMTANVIEMMLIAFAVIIVLVSLLVSNFRINNSISEEMQNMGALKAMGYSGKQIILSVICPYILTGIIAAIIGSSLSFLVLPVFESALNSQTGLLWEEGFNIKSIILTVVVIFTLVTIIAYSSARKIKHLKPITALRDGVKTHNFKKNYFHIETTKGNINLIIALKNLIRNLKQNILLLIVSIVVSLAIIFTGVLFYNICYEPKPFINAINEEIPSVSFNITDSEKKNEIKNSIEKLDSVNKTLYYDSDNVSVKGEKTPTIIVEDYSLLENNLCYEGRNPEHDNEVALGNVLAKDKNLSIGDTVEINFSGNSKKYLITGLIQHVDNNGIVCEFTKEGFSKINNNFSPSNLYVYLNDEDKAEEVVNEVIDRYGDNIGSQVNYVKTREAAMGVFLNIAGLILVIIVVATTLIITLILYLLIKTSITNRKQEIGILKSIGYTTWQLIMQTTFSFLPTIIVGSVLGSIIGYFKMNSIILMIFKSIGVMRMQLYIPGFVVITSALAIIIVSFIISILISNGIKKISAYSLIKE
ncbi:MAG: FtsX-like permease family protein [Clostridiaceae bacterium]|nr:FtsX-like permease family protein [Clostridiaceae bacterium]